MAICGDKERCPPKGKIFINFQVDSYYNKGEIIDFFHIHDLIDFQQEKIDCLSERNPARNIEVSNENGKEKAGGFRNQKKK